jgi:redox-sensitive bicupin YhaK (pirin superfamily)
MPAVTVEDTLLLPAIDPPPPDATRRPALAVVSGRRQLEGAGFEVRRTFPGLVPPELTDPFLLLDHIGAVEYGPFEAVGAPDHPHRGFETVTYMLDGELEHRDSNGGGGVISGGDTQWMTAGAGIVHSEMPTDRLYRAGGVFHGFQLWVNLPAAQKWTAPRYQDLSGGHLTLVRSPDGSTLVRLIAGDLAGHAGPGQTQTPITYAHASLQPGARLEVPWREDFNALVYGLAGQGTVGADAAPIGDGQLAVLGPGDVITVTADRRQPSNTSALEVLLLGGRPIREPVVFYGPFVMNNRAEVIQAIEDYQAGRMGRIPAVRTTPAD